MSRIIHFDVTVGDVERASAFYDAAFGWKVQKWDGPMEYWFVRTGDESSPGIDGGLGVGEQRYTEPVLTLGVDDVKAVIERVKEHGGTVVREPSPVQGTGFLATVSDTEGNQFGLMQLDSKA